MALIDYFAAGIAPRIARGGLELKSYLALRRSRRALARLDARELDDIGISSEVAQQEARRRIWDVPETWTNQ